MIVKMRKEEQRQVASPTMSQQPPSYTDPAYKCPQGFWINIPPNFISIWVRHQGEVTQARYVTVKFYHDPIVWGTMGRGFQVFEQPAHAAPRLTPREATPYVHNDLQLLTSRYPGHDWVNNALIDKGDEGLRAEALCYRRMMDKMTDKMLCSVCRVLRQSQESKISEPRQSPRAPFLHGWWSEGVPPEEAVMSRPLPWWVLHGRGYVSY